MKKKIFSFVLTVMIICFIFFNPKITALNKSLKSEFPKYNNIEIRENVLSQDIKSIKEKGYLTVALYGKDRLGFFENKDSDLKGFEIDLARKIANSLEVELKFERSSQTYDGLVDLLILEKADIIISTFSATPNRALYLAFSNPYEELRTGVMLSKKYLAANKIEKNPIEHLKNYKTKLCVQKNSSYSDTAKKLFPLSEFVEIEDTDLAFEMTKNNEVDGFFSGELEFVEQSIKDPILSIYTKTYVFSDINDNFCIALPKKSTEFMNFINICISSFKKTTINEIEEEYKNIFNKKESKE
ncbi:MAG: transporter substrate-binding domain-containing protein [Oscillospiraceae bacterium]|nr:transporter substrate-binding domain-containing protein [Oscillospiraceae bacterium]